MSRERVRRILGPSRRRHHRRRAGRPHRRLPALQTRCGVHHPRGRRRGGRHQPHRGARRMALRHRRPPVFHEGPTRRGALVRDPRPRRLLAPTPQEPHLLRREVHRLPVGSHQRVAEPRVPRGGPLRRLLRLGSDPPAERPDQPRGLLRRPLRMAALPHLLQDLHREGLGCPRLGDRSRLGCPAGQGPLLVPRRLGGAEAQVDPTRPGQVPAGHQPHRGVQLPEVRAGNDVGASRGTRHRPRNQDRVRVLRQHGASPRRTRHRRHRDHRRRTDPL